jgi:hypothetical protein
MFDEVAFIRDLRKIEWSLNALHQLLAPLKRPYTLSHGEHFFNFREMKMGAAGQVLRDEDGHLRESRCRGRSRVRTDSRREGLRTRRLHLARLETGAPAPLPPAG